MELLDMTNIPYIDNMYTFECDVAMYPIDHLKLFSYNCRCRVIIKNYAVIENGKLRRIQ